MNKIYGLLFIVAAFLLLPFSCNQEQGSEIELSESILQAKEWYDVQKVKTSSTQSRITPDWSRAKEKTLRLGMKIVIVPVEDEFQLQNNDIAYIRGFIFSFKNGSIRNGKIVEILGDPDFVNRKKEYLFTSYLEEEIEGFTGNIIIYNLSYRYLRGRVFEDGRRISAVANVQAGNHLATQRLADTYARNSEEVCYDWYLVTYYSDGTTDWEYLYTTCSGGGGGGGQGSGQPTIMDVNDFTKDGFPSNPVDGQTHVVVYADGSSIEFTYKSHFGSWMLPEITILDEGSDFEIESYTYSPPTFGYESILTLAAPALVEPTPVGEIFVAGYAAVVATIYLVELTDYYLNSLNHREHCVDLYELCTQNTPSVPCGDCLNYCIAQGYWHFELCPNVNIPE